MSVKRKIGLHIFFILISFPSITVLWKLVLFLATECYAWNIGIFRTLFYFSYKKILPIYTCTCIIRLGYFFILRTIHVHNSKCMRVTGTYNWNFDEIRHDLIFYTVKRFQLNRNLHLSWNTFENMWYRTASFYKRSLMRSMCSIKSHCHFVWRNATEICSQTM